MRNPASLPRAVGLDHAAEDLGTGIPVGFAAFVRLQHHDVTGLGGIGFAGIAEAAQAARAADRPDIHHGIAVRIFRRPAFHPVDGFVHRSGLDDADAGDQFLRFGEGAVLYHGLPVRSEGDAHSFAAGLQAFAGEKTALGRKRVHIVAHRFDELARGTCAGFTIVVRLADYQELHGWLLTGWACHRR